MSTFVKMMYKKGDKGHPCLRELDMGKFLDFLSLMTMWEEDPLKLLVTQETKTEGTFHHCKT